MERGLHRLAVLHGIPYLHVHMAFYTFHSTLGAYLRREYPREGHFLLTRREIVLIAYMYGLLPEPLRERGNLMYILYGLLTLYFSFWAVDFTPLQVHHIARMLELEEENYFEELVVYLSQTHFSCLYGIATDSEAYCAWENYLFAEKKVSRV